MTEKAREGPSDTVVCREVRLSYGPRRKCEAIKDSRSAAALARRIVDPRADREHFAGIYLDARNVPLGWRIVSIGTLTGSLVAPREVFRPAILVGAAALIVVHNHPSGDSRPSLEDAAVTDRLVSVGDMIGIRVLDHIVLGDREHYSFADEGRLPQA